MLVYAAICKAQTAQAYTPPLESNLPVASSSVGGLGFSFLVPNILFIPQCCLMPIAASDEVNRAHAAHALFATEANARSRAQLNTRSAQEAIGTHADKNK